MELLLMTLLALDGRGDRVFVVDSITKQIRGGGDSGTCLPMTFVLPVLSFQAQMLTELVDWGTTSLTKPVLAAFLSYEELQACKDAPLRVPETWQCHSEDIEKVVNNV